MVTAQKQRKIKEKTLVDQTPIINITSIFRNLKNSNGKGEKQKNKKEGNEETCIQRMLHR